MMQKETRQQRRAREREERRSQERPTFERMMADIDRSRTTQLVRNHAGNRLPLSHEINQHKLDGVFVPIFEWLETLEQTGDMEVTDKGVPIFKPAYETEYVPLIDSFESMCDTFENVARDLKIEDESGGLRRLARKLAVDMPLVQADTDAARAALHWMIATIKPLTPSEFEKYLLTAQIRAEFQDLEKAGRAKRHAR